MKRTVFLMVAIVWFGVVCVTARADEKSTIDLFNRWEQVWHEGRFDLVPGCVAEIYIRHDTKAGRAVTREAYPSWPAILPDRRWQACGDVAKDRDPVQRS
jgi:hypothetical protein